MRVHRYINRAVLFMACLMALLGLSVQQSNPVQAQQAVDSTAYQSDAPVGVDNRVDGGEASQCVSFISENLTSNRYDALPNGRLQVAVWYDGKSDANIRPVLYVQYRNPNTGSRGWISIGTASDPGGRIDRFDTRVETREYSLGACQLTGVVWVSGIKADGQTVDGLAFGLYTKSSNGQYQLWKSRSNTLNTPSDYVGAWPSGFSDNTFNQRTPQITDGIAKEQAEMMIRGAKLLGYGQHTIKPVAPTTVAGSTGSSPNCGVRYLTQNLTSNRYSGLAKNRLQAVAWYDGSSNANPTLRLEYIDPANRAKGWITVGGNSDPGGKIDRFNTQIESREYDLGSCVLTGITEVNGVINDGVVDGLAFGLYSKNNSGKYGLCQSWSNSLNRKSDYIGGWPLGFSSSTFSARTSQISNGIAREQALMAITGAKLLGNGRHSICPTGKIQAPPPKPDLTPLSVDFSHSCQATIRYKNIGNASVTGYSNLRAETFLGGNNASQNWQIPPTIYAGSTGTRNWYPNGGKFASQVRVTVDANSHVNESNESNNVQTFTVPVRCQQSDHEVGPTPTPTPTPTTSTSSLYFSSSSSGYVGGVSFRDEDILAFNPSNKRWSLYFDGSDVGLSNRDVNAFHVQSDGNILFSLDSPQRLGGIYYDDSDVIKFTASSLGASTRGSFSMYFDGSDVSLTSSNEDIDAIAVLSNGDLVLSTIGTAWVSGATARDEDMLRFRKTQYGNNTRGSWSLYLDGSDIGLTTYAEDIWAAGVANDNLIHLSTLGNYNVSSVGTSLRGDSDDIIRCNGTLGNNTSCRLALGWNGDSHGFGNEQIDGYSVGPAPRARVFSAEADENDVAEEAPSEAEDDKVDDMLDDDEYTERVYLPLISR